MSAPQGPRLRSGSRGPRNARASTRSRANGHVGRERKPSRRAPIASAGNQSRHPLKQPSSHTIHPNKSWRNPASLSSAIQSHAGKLSNAPSESWRNASVEDSRSYKQRMNELYQTLKQNREKERKDAISDGFLADPDKPTSLANAITPVGICQDMCPEFERVERIVQLMVDGREKVATSSDPNTMVPLEEIMVKRFRRSAAGYDEQLPSDIRPPLVLKKTLDYLINDVVGGPESLATVHKFVWDRTRGIRNDFSIQQVTKMEDLRIAIECFERIARFHILSLHQLSGPEGINTSFDHHQEREQLNNTLLSLMYYYDDSRHRLTSPNEAEFRAYCVIFEIQDQRPDLEDRMQNLPRHLLKDRRVQTALKLYAAAGNTSDEQGPLRPRTQFLSAQANTGGFWNLLRSNAVSYLMACVAEIYFELVRRTALQNIWKAYKGKRGGPSKVEDWTIKDLTQALGFDEESQAKEICRSQGFKVHEKGNGDAFIELGLETGTVEYREGKQTFSKSLVEIKRLGRVLPAVINGMSVSQARAQGCLEYSSDADTASVANSDSLFITGDSDEQSRSSRSRSASPQTSKVTNGKTPQLNAVSTPFTPKTIAYEALPAPNPFATATTFGKPSSTLFSIQASSDSPSTYNTSAQSTTQAKPNPFASNHPPQFNFHTTADPNTAQKTTDNPNLPISKEPSNPISFTSPLTTNQQENRNVSTFFPFTAPLNRNLSSVGKPSTSSLDIKPSSSARTNFGQPSASPANTANNQAKSVFDEPPSSTPTFSFGTSPLFQLDKPKENDQNDQRTPSNPSQSLHFKFPDTSSSQSEDVAIKTPLFTTPSMPEAKPPSLFPPPAPPISSTSPFFTNKVTPPSNPELPEPSASSQFSSLLTAPHINTALSHQLIGRLSPQPSLSFPIANVPSPVQEQNRAQELTALHTPALPHPPLTKYSPFQYPQQQQASGTLPLNQRSTALDQLSRDLLLGDNGILQHFIQYTVGPIITSSLAQLEDESSREKARECRVVLLAKKFFGRWKANAWKRSLMRKGKKRRENFAMAVQNTARSKRQKTHDLNSSISSHTSSTGASESLTGRENSSNRMMQPPSTPFHKRQSLPPNLNHTAENENTVGTKRKREDPVADGQRNTPKYTNISHQRSRTIGTSIMSGPPHRPSRSPYKSRMDLSTVKDGSLLSDILVKQARRLAPNAKSDTTRTDYFQLKALGVDPDTPVVPLGKKRTGDGLKTDGTQNSVKTSPPRSAFTQTAEAASQSAAQTPSGVDDEDEALFAQIRSVREALAESEQWCKNERQTIERSMTPQASSSPPEAGTPGQRRLREIRERGSTPSRTELRLRAMGDRALLPKGFWDGEGMGRSLMRKGKEKEEGTPATDSMNRSWDPIGAGPAMSAAPIRLGQMDGLMNGQIGGGSDQRRQANKAQKGSSEEDAIEL